MQHAHVALDAFNNLLSLGQVRSNGALGAIRKWVRSNGALGAIRKWVRNNGILGAIWKWFPTRRLR
jgi:hypothetical protein